MESLLKYLSENIIPALLVMVIAGLFNMYTDLLVLRGKFESQERDLQKVQKYSEKFDEVLQKFDRTLAIQGETVKALQETISKLEDNSNPRRNNDRRN